MILSDQLASLRAAVNAMLSASSDVLSKDEVEDWIRQMRLAFSSVTDDQAKALSRELMEVHDVSMSLGATLETDEFEKWLDGASPDIDFYFWRRYRDLLAQKGFSKQVLASLDQVTERTLGLLGNPRKEGEWKRRGLVVGHVQSGKTANYIGLLSKAADAGYKVIIVIAGIHNNLRSQTQERIDEGFIGQDSAALQVGRRNAAKRIGVGRHDATKTPVYYTSRIKDFNKPTATSVNIPFKNLNQPAVFVIKKNSSTLKNLIEWLKAYNARQGTRSIEQPMLLIDDEADNASINIKKGSEEVSRINGQIRQLLESFDRSCYVGYTATPFANIFIDPRDESDMFGADLFPEDFIVSLDPPDNYFGPGRVFLGKEDAGDSDCVRHIDDNEELLPLKHEISHQVVALPDSLESAVRTFILVIALRRLRGSANAHNSMLVNASRFTGVQGQLRNEIHDFVDKMSASIRVNGQLEESAALRDVNIRALRDVYCEEYTGAVDLPWAEVQAELWQAVSVVKVIAVNSKSNDTLDYADHQNTGLNVIAVGGFSLSRGLTLEGLSVSYFLRNSMMYDTLMQMGRWFGYRVGYDDLCRIWMPEFAEGWYRHIAESMEELRDELREMQVAGATPREFGLKVRSHPDNLIVTARNKMGAGERLPIRIGLASRFVETTIISERYAGENRQAARSFVADLADDGHAVVDGEAPILGSGFLQRDIDVAHVLSFLRSFRNAHGATLTQTDPLCRYIEDRASGELSQWNVLFPSLGDGTQDHIPLATDLLGFPVICQRRSEGSSSGHAELRISDNQRVASRGIEKVDLTKPQRSIAEAAFRKEKNYPDDKKGINYPDRFYRRQRVKPLLVVHLLAIGDKHEDLSGLVPRVAWSISFPDSEHPEKTVEYVVNPTWFEERYREEADEDESGGDDD